MSFSNAFRYPFQNIAKVISIVLVLTIAFALAIGLMLNSHDWSPLLAQLYELDPSQDSIGEPGEMASAGAMMGASAIVGALGLVVVAIVSGFWISGYSVEVIRSVMKDMEFLPDIEFSKNLKDGFYLFISSVAYWLLFLVLLVAEFIVINITNSLGAINVLVILASVIVTVVALAVMGWAYFVGMARFAAEGDHRAAWQTTKNMRTARESWPKGASLLFYMIVLSVIYGIVRGIVDGVFGGVAGMLGITLSIVIYYVFNLMQHFSTQHLIAQFATEIGIGGDQFDPDKDKVDFV